MFSNGHCNARSTATNGARLILAPESGTLFADSLDEGDIESGTIYVLRSTSSHPFIAEHRELIHKIGVTGGDVETRIAGAEKDATYLFQPVLRLLPPINSAI